MAYLIVLQLSDQQHYLELTDNGAISAYETDQAALQQFDSFRRHAKSSDYSNHISGSFGILQISPHIIKWDKSAEELKEYMVDGKVQKFKGGVAHVSAPVTQVKKEILQHSIIDVSKHIIDDVYKGI